MIISFYHYLLSRLSQYRGRRQLVSKYTDLSIGANCSITGSTFGRNVKISPNATILNSHIDDFTYVGPGSVICYAEIGKYCSIAPETYIGMGTHPSNYVSTHPRFYLSRPAEGWSIIEKDYFTEFQYTKVGNDVWFGLRSAIRDGVRIGDGAIIGAGAVVVKDVLPYSVQGGVPAKEISKRFAADEVDFLLNFKWWDKDDQWLKENSKCFYDIRLLMNVSSK
jgi:acetyltransferase-like isoleucine patch superfamily enzyme